MMRRPLPPEQRERVRQGVMKELTRLVDARRIAWEVDDHARPPDARNPSGQHPVRSMRSALQAECLGDPGCVALDHGPGRLRRDVVRREPGSPGRQDQVAAELVRAADQRDLDLITLIGHQLARDELGAERLGECREALAAFVLRIAGGSGAGDRDDCRPQLSASSRVQRPLRPPSFSTSSIDSIATPRSSPLTMS